MSTHTLGPWELCEVTDGDGRAVDDDALVVVGELDEDDCCEIKIHGKNAAAIARLIAAAPELRNGCNALLGLIQMVANRDDCPAAIKNVLEHNHRVVEAGAAVKKSEATS